MVRSYLRLLRIPNVFTACANVVAGVCLARGGGFQARDIAVVLASGCLYCAGMVWNDFFDRQVDARERPERPIPAGEVSATAAATLGCTLSALGLGLAAWHGPWPALLAVLVLAAVFAYDAAFKDSWAGPLTMGACRALNVLLGMSVNFQNPAWQVPLWLVLGVFTLLITELSRFEVGGTETQRVRATLQRFLGLGVAAGTVLCAVAWRSGADVISWLSMLALLVFVVRRERRLLAPIWLEATGPTLGRAIGGGILLMPAIDASFVAASGAPLAAAATLAFMAPAWLLKRWYYLT